MDLSQHFDASRQVSRLLLEIDRLIHTCPNEVPEESKFLLEVDFARLRQGDLTSQNYWVQAVKAAVVAGRQKTFLHRRRRCAASPPSDAPTSTSAIPFAPPDNIVHTERIQAVKRVHLGSGSVHDDSNKRRRPD
eukprot:scaffold38273_cov70-Cyclotella_meneghiniana.AAC.3